MHSCWRAFLFELKGVFVKLSGADYKDYSFGNLIVKKNFIDY